MLTKHSRYWIRNWLFSLFFMLLKLVITLPLTWQYAVGRMIGKIAYLFSSKLRLITETNIRLCFPEKSILEQQHLCKENFTSMGIGIVELAIAWMAPASLIKKLRLVIHGKINLELALTHQKGVLLLGPHFHCLEMIGRLLEGNISFATMYRPHKNPYIAKCQDYYRKQYAIKKIAKHQLRKLIQTLKENHAVWYAYDIDGGQKRSVFAPFFNIQAASLTATSRIIKLTDAKIIPVSFYRGNRAGEYHIVFEPELVNFPTGDSIQDATLLNNYLEKTIRKNQTQYIWQYKRFKTRPSGNRLY
jgi:KDO2-lipid IV(A) lauroyltransferase